MDHRPLEDDGGSDIEEYNRELAALGETTWLHAPWLFSECYLYRYVMHIYLHTQFYRIWTRGAIWDWRKGNGMGRRVQNRDT